jgi:hypothetical protein
MERERERCEKMEKDARKKNLCERDGNNFFFREKKASLARLPCLYQMQ